MDHNALTCISMVFLFSRGWSKIPGVSITCSEGEIVSKILEEALTISKKEIITTVGGDFQEFGKL